MSKNVSLGIMEQSLMRQDNISKNQEDEIREIFRHVTHLEGKYLGTLQLLKERAETIGGQMPLILHAQYPAVGDDILNMVNPAFKSQLGDEFSRIIEMLNPEWSSFHLGFSCEELKSGGQFDFATALSEVLPEDVVKERILDNLDFVGTHYSQAGEILVENLDYNPKDKSGAYEYVCDPEFIGGIVRASGCRMLLDFGHCNVTAQNMGCDDVMGFIFQLPLEKVVEVHMSGAGRKDGLAHDTHIPINREGQPEAKYFEEALSSGRMTSLKAVTLETFEDVIPQLDLLKDVLERNGCRISAL